MKLTTQGHYSVKALLDLRSNAGDRPVSVREIAQRQQLPAPLFRKVIDSLATSGDRGICTGGPGRVSTGAIAR